MRRFLLFIYAAFQNSYVRQVSVPLGIVEPVADHEFVLDVEALEIRFDGHNAARVFIEQRADLDRRGLSRIEHAYQVRERVARIDDILDDDDVAPLDLAVEVFDQLDFARGFGSRAVGRDGHKIHFDGNAHRAKKVRVKHYAAL